jgi:hypothetical protein
MQAQKRSFSPKIWRIVGMKCGAQSLVLRFNQTKSLCYRNSSADHISAIPCIWGLIP